MSNKSNTPSPRHGHCVVSFRYKKRSGVVCFGGIDARSGKPCVDVWMMWMDEMTTWYSLQSSKNAVPNIKSGYCVESRDDSVVMSLCDVNGSVVYATLSFSKGVVIWNDNMTSPRILANISSGGTSRGDVAHVRMFDESSYFTIEKSSSGKDTTLRTSNDSCCHHILSCMKSRHLSHTSA